MKTNIKLFSAYILTLIIALFSFQGMSLKNNHQNTKYIIKDSIPVCGDSSNYKIYPKEVNLNNIKKDSVSDTTIQIEVIQGEPPQGQHIIDSLKNVILPVNQDSSAIQIKENK